MNPGSLLNHSTTNDAKSVSTAPSANLILPSLLYSCVITLQASWSPALFNPQPNVFLKLNRNKSSVLGNLRLSIRHRQYILQDVFTIYDLLQTQIHALQPQPGQNQHQEHVGKRKAKPAGEVDHIRVGFEEARKMTTWLKGNRHDFTVSKTVGNV